jgi:hypothetical protein
MKQKAEDVKKMTRINSTIDSKLEREVREVANKKFNYKKGSIQSALEEALTEWLKMQNGVKK